MALMEPSLFAKGGNNVGVNKIGTILMGKEWLNMNQATSDGVGGTGRQESNCHSSDHKQRYTTTTNELIFAQLFGVMHHISEINKVSAKIHIRFQFQFPNSRPHFVTTIYGSQHGASPPLLSTTLWISLELFHPYSVILHGYVEIPVLCIHSLYLNIIFPAVL